VLATIRVEIASTQMLVESVFVTILVEIAIILTLVESPFVTFPVV
jgi:hypothetical protein